MKKIKKVTNIDEVDNLCALYIAEENVKRARQECDYRERVLELLKGAQMRREKIAEEMQDGDHPTQWLNGEQWSCAVVARRILNKLPKLNSPKESFYIEISPSYFGGCGLSFRYINTIDKASGVTSCELIAAKDTPDEQFRKAELWLKEVEVQMDKAQEIMREEAENE